MLDEKNKLIFQTCLLLVGHITNLVEHEKSTGIRIGYHSRIFDALLHPQEHFISLGKSERLLDGVQGRIEHVVPCAYIVEKLEELIKEQKYTRRIGACITEKLEGGTYHERRSKVYGFQFKTQIHHAKRLGFYDRKA